MARPTDPAKLGNAIEAYLSGKQVEESAAIGGIGASTLWRELRKRGLFEHRRRRPTPAGLIEDFLGGMSVKATAAKYRRDRGAVYRMLHEAGINGRGRAEAMQLRWQRASAADRRVMLEAAHAASRGRQVSEEERGAIAIAKSGKPQSPHETALGTLLADLGHDIAYGVACGPYNLDIVVAGTVAVEVFGGQWHETGRHRARFDKRARHVLDAGYSLAIVWVDERRYPISVQCAQHLGTLAEIARGDPAIGGQYWVVRGDGYFLAVYEDDGNQVPFIPAAGSRHR